MPDDGLCDDQPKYTEPLERLRLVMANVNTSNPDVRTVLAHTATAVAAVLEDSADRVNDNDKLAAKVRRLEKLNERLQRAADTAAEKAQAALTANTELRLELKRERTAREVAERAHAAAVSNDDDRPELKLARENAELEQRLQRAHDDLDVQAALADAAEAERDGAEAERDEAVWRRAVLAAHLGVPDTGVSDTGEPAEELPPVSFIEVLDRAAHPLLEFTLDREIAAALDRHPRAAVWRRCTAAALATMGIYADAKARAHARGTSAGPGLADLAAFARSGCDHIAISAARIATSESATVTSAPQLAAQRRFPVPPHVSPDRAAAMFAHVRIGGRRPPAPRLHFLDRTDDPADGRIYIGYLGPHLRTSTTN